MAAETVRYAGIDGRLTDLDSDKPAHLMPLISDNWGRNFQWRGVGRISPNEKEKLRRTIAKIHAKGRRVRFWATPEAPALWEKLYAAGADFLNTDDLCGLQEFLLKKKKMQARRLRSPVKKEDAGETPALPVKQ